MSDEELSKQVAGLKRRIAALEAHNAKLIEAVAYTNKTLALCRDPTANPLAKMVDRAIAEQKLKDAMTPPELPKESAGEAAA